MSNNIIYISDFTPNLMHITVNAIDICNLSCSYCYNKSFRSKSIIDFSYVYKIITQYLNTTDKNILISIIGGEPTLHNALQEFCKIFKLNDRVSIEILSNFTNNIYVYLQLLKQKNVFFTFSYHSILSKRNTLYIENLLKILKYPMFFNKIELAIMFEQHVDIKNVINLLNDVAKNKIVISIKPIRNVVYTYDEISYFNSLNKNINYYIKYDNNIIKNVSEEYIAMHNLSFKNWKCSAGKNSLYINSNGDLYLCESQFIENKKPKHNIYDNQISTINNKDYIRCNCNVCFNDIGVPKWKDQ